MNDYSRLVCRSLFLIRVSFRRKKKEDKVKDGKEDPKAKDDKKKPKEEVSALDHHSRFAMVLRFSPNYTFRHCILLYTLLHFAIYLLSSKPVRKRLLATHLSLLAMD